MTAPAAGDQPDPADYGGMICAAWCGEHDLTSFVSRFSSTRLGPLNLGTTTPQRAARPYQAVGYSNVSGSDLPGCRRQMDHCDWSGLVAPNTHIAPTANLGRFWRILITLPAVQAFRKVSLGHCRKVL